MTKGDHSLMLVIVTALIKSDVACIAWQPGTNTFPITVFLAAGQLR